MKKLLSLILAIVTVCACLVSCGGKETENFNKAEGNKIVIGVYEPASGDNGAGGKKETLGVKYANSVVNKVTIGGVEYDVELAIVDNQSSNDKAISAATELISKNALVVLGSYGSGVSIAASDTFAEAGVPAIGITCTNPNVTAGNDHYFRACFLDPFQGTVLANYAKDELGATKAYVLAQQGSDYDVGLANYFKQGFGESNCTYATFPQNTADFTGYITAAMQASADVIFAPVSVSYAQLIVAKAHDLGYTGKILAGDTWDDNMIVAAAQSKNVDVHITTFYQEGADPTFDAAFKAYINGNAQNLADNGGNDMVSAVSVMGYDTYMTAIKALQSIDGEVTSIAVKKALAKMNIEANAYTGVTGKIYFDATGDAVRTTAFIKKIDTHNSSWTFVKQQNAK